MDYLFEKITENIRNHDNTIIMTHRHPDLDGMSSAVCLYEVIKSFKKEVYVVVPTEIVNNSLEKGLDYLRKKIDDNSDTKLIHTVRGMGYVLREEK